LRESEARFRALADASPVLVWQLGEHGEAVYFNQRCLDMTGVPLEQLLGNGWRAIVHPDDLPAYTDLLAGAVRDRTQVQARVRAKTGSGQWHWFDCHAAPWFAAAGEYRGHVGIAIDVTDAVQAEQALREGNRRKDEFLATLAHELRNPLAPIGNALCLLKYTDAGGRRTADRLVRMMDRQFGNMVRLVDDLLEIARITSGKIELARSRVDLVDIVRSAVETSAPLIQKGGHRLVLQLPDHPLWIHADAVRMNQVIANLLNNAAKYTGEGGHIVLQARAEGQQAVVSVRDDGAGIPPGMLDEVFEMFRQVPGLARQGQDGLGIGLSMVKSLMQQHGGTVEAHSEGTGKGSEFIVRMPLLEGPPTGCAGNEAPRARRGAPLSGCAILVVDDNRDAADTLAVLLQSEGAEVHVAHDGSAALAELDCYHPRVVVLDIGLPDISGYEVAQRIRSRRDFDDVRLIALTGWGQEEDRSKSRESGFNEHLTKPVDFGLLEALLTAK
jgi:PAS domain S-box-containing protein